MNENIIRKDDMIIGYPKDLTKYVLNKINYLADGDAENMVCTIVDLAHVLEDLMNYDYDKLVAICEHEDGTPYCKYYEEDIHQTSEDEELLKRAMDGEFECYSTGGGWYTSQFMWKQGHYYHVYTVENLCINNLVYWRIPKGKDMYECLGHEEYMVMEWDMNKSESSVVEKKIYEILKNKIYETVGRENICAL